MKIADRMAERMLNLNIQIRDVRHIKTHHVELYIRSRLAESISKRTLQNEMAALRAIFNVAGRSKLADPAHECLSNSALGLSGASRDGTKVAISDERYQAVFSVIKIKDEGVAAAVQLSRCLGLRTEEAVQSAKSLRTWQQALLRGDERVRVVFGTKGGKPRDTTVVDREKTLQAVNHALKIAMNNNGKLVDKPNLHSAIDRYRNIVKDAGLTGKISPHSLRYAYSARRRNIICREVLAKRKPKRWFLWIWGTGTGAGIMWREFITKESLMTISLL